MLLAALSVQFVIDGIRERADLMEGETFGRALYLVVLLAALGGWVLVEYRKRLGFALRTAMAGDDLYIGVVAGYGLWGDIRRDVRPEQSRP